MAFYYSLRLCLWVAVLQLFITNRYVYHTNMCNYIFLRYKQYYSLDFFDSIG